MPFGVYTYVGGHWPLLFPDAYHMFPANEAIFIGTWSTMVVFLYTFRNDKGQTVVERGIDEIKGGPVKKAGMQILAMIAVFQIGLLALYTVPQIAFFGSKPNEWPKDAQERSYLVDNICGPEADWACPGPSVPLNRGNARDQSGVRDRGRNRCERDRHARRGRSGPRGRPVLDRGRRDRSTGRSSASATELAP